MGVVGDVKDTLKILNPLIEPKKDDSFLKRHLKIYETVKKNLNTYVTNKGAENKIHPEYVMHLINKKADENAIESEKNPCYNIQKSRKKAIS